MSHTEYASQVDWTKPHNIINELLINIHALSFNHWRWTQCNDIIQLNRNAVSLIFLFECFHLHGRCFDLKANENRDSDELVMPFEPN